MDLWIQNVNQLNEHHSENTMMSELSPCPHPDRHRQERRGRPLARQIVWIQTRVEEVIPEYEEHGEDTDNEQGDDICGARGSAIRTNDECHSL